MPITDLYSKRLKRSLGGEPDVFAYDTIPQGLRVQIAHIWSSVTGADFRLDIDRQEYGVAIVFRDIVRTLCREYGVFQLVSTVSGWQYHLQCQQFMLTCPVDEALDMIEVSFGVFREYSSSPYVSARALIEATQELNHRFREHGVGYQLTDGLIVRVDSQLVHSEVVKPALKLLHEAGFDGASEEFLTAHEHYRHGRNKEAITEALKAYESTLKTICDQQGWKYPDTANTNKLVATIIDNGLVPRYLLDHMSGLRSALDSGLVTLRNKGAAHGQGAQPVETPDSVAAFALHLAAANIVFLVERHKELLKK